MLRDLLWALRWLRHNPLFTTVVTATLALGIGANTAVFSVVDAVLLRPLPYADAARLTHITEHNVRAADVSIPVADYLLWRSRTDLFQQLAAYRNDVLTLTGIDAPDQAFSLRTAGGLFQLLGAHAALGRVLTEADEQTAGPQAAVLSDRTWRRLFHADPRVIGRPVEAAGEVITIVGVMPPDFEFAGPNVEMWLPLRTEPASTMTVGIIARLKNGVTQAQAQAAMTVTAHQLEHVSPKDRAGLGISLSPWQETVAREYELTLIFILAAVALVLLIACANIGGLILSRAVQRQKELAIRASLGAGVWRVMRQLLAESIVLAVIGSAAGMGLAAVALRFLARQLASLPIAVPRVQELSLTGRVLFVHAALCFAATCLFSMAPMLLASKLDLQTALRTGRTSGGTRSSNRMFRMFIASEAAFAFLLLAGSGLMVRSLVRLQTQDHGMHADHVLTIRVPIGTFMRPRPVGKYDTKPRQAAYYRELLDHLQGTPGARAVALVNNIPLSGFNTSLEIQAANGREMQISARTISRQYLAVMGIPLLAGRGFNDSDQADSPGVAIVNEYLARSLFPDGNPLGQLIQRSPRPITIVGVAKDSPKMRYDVPPDAEMYIPYQQGIFGAFLATIVVRTDGNPMAVASALRERVWAVNREQPIVKIETMEDVIADSIWRPRFSAWLVSVFGALALLLTAAGIYGVVAYTTSLRAHEVGVRVALGATPANVTRLILRDSMLPVSIGLALGLIAALFLHRLLASLLYEISSLDAVSYLGAGALLLAIGAAASLAPAWKAATSDPLTALRSE